MIQPGIAPALLVALTRGQRIGDLEMFNAELDCDWLTALEAAQYLKVERRTLLDWARQGKVKGFQLSGVTRHVWRFRRSDLDAMLVPSSACSAEGGSK